MIFFSKVSEIPKEIIDAFGLSLGEIISKIPPGMGVVVDESDNPPLRYFPFERDSIKFKKEYPGGIVYGEKAAKEERTPDLDCGIYL